MMTTQVIQLARSLHDRPRNMNHGWVTGAVQPAQSPWSSASGRAKTRLPR